MSKEDKKQLIFKITLCALSFLICAYGFILRLNGYGKTGEIQKDLTEIVKIYNSLSQVEDNVADIKAKYRNKSIIVNYSTSRVDIDYEFKYEKIDNFKTIKLEYKEGDSARAEDVTRAMIEAVSMTAGNEEGKVFSQYTYQNFYKTQLKDGIKIESNDGIVTIQIVLQTNLLDNIKDMFFEESLTTHISIEDLSDLGRDLRNNQKFLITKGNIMLYVALENDTYEVYTSDKEENVKNMYESIMSVVNILNKNLYNELLNKNIDITNEITTDTYSIDIKPEQITFNQIMNDGYVIKFCFK